jgi:hypothetical protein
MTKPVFRTLAVASALVAAGALLAVPASATAPAGPTAPARAQVVPVAANPDGLVAPGAATLRPGIATFQVSTPDPAGREVGLIQLQPGVDLNTLLQNLAVVLLNNDLEAKKQAGAVVYRDSILLGGVVLQSRAPQSFSQLLRPGTYYLVDYRSLAAPNPSGHYQRIAVQGRPSLAVTLPDNVVVQYETAAGAPRYFAPARIGQHSKLLIVNRTSQMADSLFLPVRPGTTDEDITRFFAGQAAAPFIGGPQGALPAFSGYSVMLHADLTPGRYVLLSFVGDRTTGASGASRGMHTIVDVA